MRITKVYTKTGDKGTTGLSDGSRVPKTSLRLSSYGTIDELNAILGMCREQLKEASPRQIKRLDPWFEALQNDLFNLGADFATPMGGRWNGMLLIGEEDVHALEKMIDLCQEELSPLREFVLPGGTQLNALLHLARTVCRRAERESAALQAEEEINPQGLPYLNRLSDLFFVLSRWVLLDGQIAEVTWSKAKGVKSLGWS
jgi:cob(I)alamin adenosyltransferase